MTIADAIQSQNKLLEKQIEQSTLNQSTHERKSHSQNDMYETLRFVNNILIFFYFFAFALIHLLLLDNYLKGIPRNEMVDSFFFNFFFFYPYIIYSLESWLYSLITYILTFIYGNTYVYQFDKIFTFTDYYTSPEVKLQV